MTYTILPLSMMHNAWVRCGKIPSHVACQVLRHVRVDTGECYHTILIALRWKPSTLFPYCVILVAQECHTLQEAFRNCHSTVHDDPPGPYSLFGLTEDNLDLTLRSSMTPTPSTPSFLPTHCHLFLSFCKTPLKPSSAFRDSAPKKPGMASTARPETKLLHRF